MNLDLRGGILMSIEDFPESLSQRILAGIILAGRLGICEGYGQISKVQSGQMGLAPERFELPKDILK